MEREEAGNPIRVGVIGAGFFGGLTMGQVAIWLIYTGTSIYYHPRALSGEGIYA